MDIAVCKLLVVILGGITHGENVRLHLHHRLINLEMFFQNKVYLADALVDSRLPKNCMQFE